MVIEIFSNCRKVFYEKFQLSKILCRKQKILVVEKFLYFLYIIIVIEKCIYQKFQLSKILIVIDNFTLANDSYRKNFCLVLFSVYNYFLFYLYFVVIKKILFIKLSYRYIQLSTITNCCYRNFLYFLYIIIVIKISSSYRKVFYEKFQLSKIYVENFIENSSYRTIFSIKFLFSNQFSVE